MQSPDRGCEPQREILNARYSEYMGSKWDSKLIGGNDIPLTDLRYKVAIARVVDRWTYSAIRERFHVSDGFIRKWSRLYKAYLEEVERHPRQEVQIKERFKSISNRPKNVTTPVQDRIRDAVEEERELHGFEGAFRLKAILHLDVSPSTINKVLRSKGLLSEPKKRHVNKVYGSFQRPYCLVLVQTDYKTWNIPGNEFKTIWILDDCTRSILAHRVVKESSAKVVIELLEQVIEMYGKPKQILSDHGTEFHSVTGGKGRSKLDKFCNANGIEHIMGRVRHPQTQGKMERTHRSASEEVLSFGSLDTFEDAQKAFARWVEYYNWERPHQALNYMTPGVAFLSLYSIDLDAMMTV